MLPWMHHQLLLWDASCAEVFLEAGEAKESALPGRDRHGTSGFVEVLCSVWTGGWVGWLEGGRVDNVPNTPLRHHSHIPHH